MSAYGVEIGGCAWYDSEEDEYREIRWYKMPDGKCIKIRKEGRYTTGRVLPAGSWATDTWWWWPTGFGSRWGKSVQDLKEREEFRKAKERKRR